MFNNSPFIANAPDMSGFEEADVVFVSDMFAEKYQGGAELSTEALFEATPETVSVYKMLASNVSLKLLEQGQNKHWVFFNYASLDKNLIPTIIANMSYSVVEYDFKYCKWRSPEKHLSVEGLECNCDETLEGKMISAFYHGAKTMFWMSEKQAEKYYELFPFLKHHDDGVLRNDYVLSSIFSEKFFAATKLLREWREENPDEVSENYLVLGSPSWIKGRDAAIEYCQSNNLPYEEVWGLSHQSFLEKMSKSKGLVFLPAGGDTCPRIVIEAKLLGLDLVLNENVLHKDEEWFATDDLLTTESYLYAARESFWNVIKYHLDYRPTLSGYLTTYNCIENGYPWKMTVESLIGFCDEVCIMDGGSSDGTWDELVEWSKSEPKLKIDQHVVDWDQPDFAVQDGLQKARARKMCTKDFCWQMDADEFLPAKYWDGVHRLLNHFPKVIDVVDIPIVEYWGSKKKIRIDINPWKWRLTRNKPEITHGIPAELRKEEGDRIYAMQGTDGCDYIGEDGERLAHYGFYNQEVHRARLYALMGSKEALEQYGNWYKSVVEAMPTVVHYSWLDIPKKIRFYRDYWSEHWVSLYGGQLEDTAENNMFFDKPWDEVSEEEIDDLGNRLAKEMGGWIFHQKIDWAQPTPWISIDINESLEKPVENSVEVGVV